jgi:hypothetical protein
MSVFTKFTNGDGNNLFQYFCGDVLSHRLKTQHFHPALPLLGVQKHSPTIKFMLTKVFAKVVRDNWSSTIENSVDSKSYIIDGYPEDYNIFIEHKDRLSKFVRKNAKKSDYFDGVVIHLRLGDRLFRKSDYLPGMKLDIDKLANLLDSLGSQKIKVVSDLNLWKTVDASDLNKINSHVDVPAAERQDDALIVQHLNTIHNFFVAKKAIFNEDTTVRDDFSEMLNSRYLVFQHGTLAWWAGFCGEHEKVFVCDGWRPVKGVNNKNLDKTPLENWSNW